MPDSTWWDEVRKQRDSKVRLAVRGFVHGIRIFEERVSVGDGNLDAVVSEMATRHATLLDSTQHMIEIEFLDELNPERRFFRCGTDPSGMVDPVAVDPSKPDDVLRKWGGVKRDRRQ